MSRIMVVGSGASAVLLARMMMQESLILLGKPAEIIEKMIEGGVRKYAQENSLLSQVFVIDGETKIADVLKNAEKEVGAPVSLTKFVRFALGEGIEKVETDFAAEVAATSGVK